MFSKRRELFLYPDSQMLRFDRIVEDTATLPLLKNDGICSLEAVYKHNEESSKLIVYSRLLQKGVKGSPVILFLPWYGGKSIQAKKFFDSRHHPDWTYIGIDIFNTRKDFNDVLESAVASQYAYALVMRMMNKQIRLVHDVGKRVGVVAISYGANILNAYASRGLELPDAMVAVEGGSILQTTLETQYQGHKTDPRTLTALKNMPDLLPSQDPIDGQAASISAAVINVGDRVVIGQETLWKHATEKMYIHGPHLVAPLVYRRRILRFLDNHLEKKLMAEKPLEGKR